MGCGRAASHEKSAPSSRTTWAAAAGVYALPPCLRGVQKRCGSSGAPYSSMTQRVVVIGPVPCACVGKFASQCACPAHLRGRPEGMHAGARKHDAGHALRERDAGRGAAGAVERDGPDRAPRTCAPSCAHQCARQGAAAHPRLDARRACAMWLCDVDARRGWLCERGAVRCNVDTTVACVQPNMPRPTATPPRRSHTGEWVAPWRTA